MNRKEKQKLRQLRSTRQLMGMERVGDGTIETAHGTLAVLLLQPVNLAVL